MSSFRLFSKYGFTAALFISVLACGTALYIPTAENTPDPQSMASRQAGRKLYIAKCSSCHNLYSPQSHTSAQWTHQMEEMKIQAKITDDQAHLILDYLTNYPETQK